jgi:microcystin-dependent protein
MSDPFVGEVKVAAFNFAQRGWALCDGALMQISQNTALYRILGTKYGGDGKSTFALPRIVGSVAVGAGQGPALEDYPVGRTGGVTSVTLTAEEMPAHTHNLLAVPDPASSTEPNARRALARSRPGNVYVPNDGEQPTDMAPEAVSASGDGKAHDNTPPGLALLYMIAVHGIYPEP